MGLMLCIPHGKHDLLHWDLQNKILFPISWFLNGLLVGSITVQWISLVWGQNKVFEDIILDLVNRFDVDNVNHVVRAALFPNLVNKYISMQSHKNYKLSGAESCTEQHRAAICTAWQSSPKRYTTKHLNWYVKPKVPSYGGGVVHTISY